ncbi:MAG: hypothetical protein IPI77_16365 [Saprospiraceae bacterium]|nr:hypothetical protein [Saprospiraceae bacterium]
MHDVSIRVPLIIYDPRKSTAINKTLDQMVLNIDVAPTILNLAGIPIPGGCRNKSLLPLMKGNINNWRDSIFCEHLMDEPKFQIVNVFEQSNGNLSGILNIRIH